MLSREEFVKDALSNYGELPQEPNPLYKKYSMEVSLPESNHAKDSKELERISRQVSESTKIKFDAIVSGETSKSNSDLVKVLKWEDLYAHFDGKKLFKSSDDKLAAYVNAHSRDFLVINAEGKEDKRVNLLFLNSEALAVQVIINAAAGSRVNVFEIFVSESEKKGAVAVLHEINAADGSEVEINALHNEGRETDVVNLYKADVGNSTKLRANFVYNGGHVTKSRGIVDSSGTESIVDINEIAFGNGSQRFDLSNSISNTRPRSHAQLNSGAVLDGNSQCMLKGFAKVEKGTKGCFSRITERGILLSPDAHIDALPDMSIDYSNEVKATHSAATSPIDKEALFYLQSRGLEEAQAKKAFIIAFMSKYLSNMTNGAASEIAMDVMLQKLEQGTFGVISDLNAKGVWISK